MGASLTKNGGTYQTVNERKIMAANTKNKYPADKAGTKYSEFRNTKRTSPSKIRTDKDAKQSSGRSDQGADNTA